MQSNVIDLELQCEQVPLFGGSRRANEENSMPAGLRHRVTIFCKPHIAMPQGTSSNTKFLDIMYLRCTLAPRALTV